MKKINVNNCENCDYRVGSFKSEDMTCDRPVKKEGRVATNLGNVELPCPCHSTIDTLKKENKYFDRGEFHMSKEKLLELAKKLFG
ncbi:hypothetical protein [Clostridium estertheticum]|uniref:hypothetical protein n=1 Tax=Clostridium estertheticum TaxID=238834 RepID=UPI001C0DE4A6|nr:hypothetical protein [Clostridium estertheticum]MBU3186637.1 hypothetical protein [Clostridium estertheticum]